MINPSPTPKTPVRTPQPGNSNQISFQLTPIWEEIVKNQRLPPEVNENAVFQEISARLENPEWPVRQHAFRVLYDIITITRNDHLDERIVQHDIIRKAVLNLGQPAPGIRKVASETIREYLKRSKYSERMLQTFIQCGLQQESKIDGENSHALSENVTLGTIISLFEILKPFLVPENGGYAISSRFLGEILKILSNKTEDPLYKEKCLETVNEIRKTVGEARFVRALDYESVEAPSPLKESPSNLDDSGIDLKLNPSLRRDTEDNSWSDETKSELSFCEPSFGKGRQESNDQSFELQLSNSVTTYHNYNMISRNHDEPWKTFNMPSCPNKGQDESTDEFSDVTDTDTYTKESCNIEEVSERYSFEKTGTNETVQETKDGHRKAETFQGREKGKDADGKVQLLPCTNPKIVLETEIKFSQEKAIKMTIVEDEGDAISSKESEIDLFPKEKNDVTDCINEKRFVTENGDLVMKILHNEEKEATEDEEGPKRTPRRVRFGGEVIKLRTPDSDATDITIEIRQVNAAQDEPRKKPETDLKPKVERLVLADKKGNNQSHIPLPVVPLAARTSPIHAESNSLKKVSSEGSKLPVPVPMPKDGGESLNSSSSSEADLKMHIKTHQRDRLFWKWSELGIVDDQILSDLKLNDEWKVQLQALEQLKATLISPKTVDKIIKNNDGPSVASLFRCLLHLLPVWNNQQITALSVSVVFQLLQTLPKQIIQDNLEDIVTGLCKYIGGHKNVNLKIEAVQSLKMLFGKFQVSSVIDILLGEKCLNSFNSKLRENSLLVIMYASMTFPSNLFDADKILEKICNAAGDPRRRVRHASLEAIAILSQFCSSEILTNSIARVAERLPSNSSKTGFISAVQARLSRRVLPTISHEGLVLYALQIPASRRFGGTGNPIGADVDWILLGTGSVSTGSAKSRCQLNAAQRLDVYTPISFSPTKWSVSSRSSTSPLKFLPRESADKRTKQTDENPWTMQKNRTEFLAAKPGKVQSGLSRSKNRFYKTQSMGSLSAGNAKGLRFSSNENLYEDGDLRVTKLGDKDSKNDATFQNKVNREEEVTWALVPLSNLDEQSFAARNKSNSVWRELNIENGQQYFSSSLGSVRPLYLKLHPGHEQLSLNRSSDDVRKTSGFEENRRFSPGIQGTPDHSQIRILTPSVLRDRNKNEDLTNSESSSVPARVASSGAHGDNEDRSKVPHLETNSSRKLGLRPLEGSQLFERKHFESEDTIALRRSILASSQGFNETFITSPSSGNFLPDIRSIGQCEQPANDSRPGYNHKPPLQSRFSEIDEMKLQDTMSQLSGLLTTSKSFSKSLPSNNAINDTDVLHKNKYVEDEIIFPISNSGVHEKRPEEMMSNNKSVPVGLAHNKLFERSNVKPHHSLIGHSAVSAPATINGNKRDLTPSTSSSNSTDAGGSCITDIRNHRLINEPGALQITSSVSYQNLNSHYNQKVKAKRAALSKHSNKVASSNGNPFPDNLKPFDRPKDGLDTCFNQLESQQWEVTMMGLSSLVRLLRHHPSLVIANLHPIAVALGRHVKNLRSQVSRAACQVSAEMFSTLKRNLETDLDELAGPLFHRCADTNRFIRSDCNNALDNMSDHITPARVIAVISTRGATHQNATVRSVSARLLLRLSEKIGCEKIMALPKEIRDKMLITGANLLMEGKLETRSFAKQLFRVWSQHPNFSNLILDAVPPNIMRHINKTLVSLKS